MLLVVIGHGRGVSHATAVRFGRGGYDVAVVGRDAGRLGEGVARLADAGVPAASYTADAGDSDQVRRVLERIRSEHGPVSALLWTAFGAGAVPDVLGAAPDAVQQAFQVGVTGLLAAVQACEADLRATPGAAVLVANGALGDATETADRMAAAYGIDGSALEDAAKTKLVGLLAERLRDADVHVAEVVVEGRIAGTSRISTETSTAIAPERVADAFWELTHARDTRRRRVKEKPGADLRPARPSTP